MDRGFNDCQISRLTDIPRSTVREWRHAPTGRYGRRGWSDPDCPTCNQATVDGSTYAYLLGLYLGDGCISALPRGVYKLRIIMDARYHGIIEECAIAMRGVRPSTDMKVGRVRNPGCIEICAHWKHWPCLFPQHGPGRKHERKIELQPWQLSIVDRHPDRLLRGLIHSDGYRGPNYVNGKSYPRYQFSNRSKDIRDIFCRACDVYGVRWRQMNRWVISIARAPDVAKLDDIIGPKS
ncbi:MAG: hypothetical protein ACRDHO_15015 [Actinomycetota bacterium]